MFVKDSLKQIVPNPTRFVESLVAFKVKSLSESNPLKRRLNRIKLLRLYIHCRIGKVSKSNAKIAYKKDESKELRQLILGLSKQLVSFEDLQPALLHV